MVEALQGITGLQSGEDVNFLLFSFAMSLAHASSSAPAAYKHTAEGGLHSCGITESGEAWCWGRSGFGQLGDGQFVEDVREPVKVQTDVRFKSIHASSVHTCALSMDSELYCWGAGTEGQLGQGDAHSALPIRVSFDSQVENYWLSPHLTCIHAPEADEMFCVGTFTQYDLVPGGTVRTSSPARVKIGF